MTPGRKDLTRGWCPGALRPMDSGDGLLVRIKPSCGQLSLDQALQIASLATDHGNGLLELTSRGNLQLRGVRPETLEPLTAAVAALELLDDTPEAEAVRNIISTPLAGLDPSAHDTRAVTAQLEAHLGAHAIEFAALSDKFGFVIDGGGTLPLTSVEADIHASWSGEKFAVGLARDAGTDWIGSCQENELPAVAIALIRHVLAAGQGARRMRDLPQSARRDAASIAGLGDVPLARNRTAPAGISLMGCLAQTETAARPGPVAVCIGLPYGGAAAPDLSQWLAAAREEGVPGLRLTPWRAILAPVADTSAAARLLGVAQSLGFITTANDPRRAIAACPGAPACANGSTPVRANADTFAKAAAPLLQAGAILHVSGCRKGCARRQPATLTLVAEAGRYGLVVNGAATATAFGQFTAVEAAETLARLASAVTKAGYESGSGGTAAIETALKEILAA